MEEHNNDDMDSLFEGMILFPPQTVVKNDATDVVSSTMDSCTSGLSTVASLSTEPLDENLFSDLTVITPSYTETTETKMELPSDPSPVMTSSTLKTDARGAPAVSIFRQTSRKKKRAGLRIGYGRDSQLADELEPGSDSFDSLPIAENSLSVPPPTTQTDFVVEEDKNQETVLVSSHASHEQVNTCAIQHESECGEEERLSKQINKDLSEDLNVASMSFEEEEESLMTLRQEKEENTVSDTVEGKYDRIMAEISDKLKHVREQASSISIEKKESRRRRRKASENVELASERYKEIEKKLEEACETEDFEMADRLSESLAAAEKEKEGLLNALRDSEAYCDAIDSKLEEALEHQITIEEECVSLLQLFSKDALTSADLVFETVEVDSSKEIDQWFVSVEAVESKKLEIEIELQLVNDARSALSGSIEHLAENDIKEKEALCEKKKLLHHELDELLRLVREKEAEIAENDFKIEVVEKRIAEVFSGFKDVQTGVDADFVKLQTVLSEIESESEALSKRKEEIDEHLSQGKKRVEELRKLAVASTEQANTYEENLRLVRAIVISVLKAREEKTRLAKTEEKILADTQSLKQEISVARASLQELSSKKSSIQQEAASLKQRLLFIDKRVPELEAEKKVAAAARNFKEAARIASEAKSLTAEKETQEAKLNETELILGKIDDNLNKTTMKLNEFEELVSSKEREAAMARIQRLKLVSASALNERSAALELGDAEEANLLLAEAEISDSEAKQLQLVHNISE
ncbi:hypothetical protein RND81_13G078800 [Saponaria officinalis]|uniref:UVR domain-containing protein n=1 Tax=Saponaria officinalis TaxID=3572 RepID=A0AAW1GYT0_SAPOF